MRLIKVFACLGAVSIASTASADTLSLLYQDADDTLDLPASVEEAAAPWYFTASAGPSFAMDAKDVDDAYFKFDPGVGMNLGVGYKFDETFALEVRTGVQLNVINSIQDVPLYDLGGGETFTADGGSGELYQVPFMVDLVISVPISEKTSCGFVFGCGMQWTHFNAHSINTYLTGVQIGTGSFYQSSTAYRFELGIEFLHQISHNVQIGGGVLFSRTTEVNIGPSTFNANLLSPVPSSTGTEDGYFGSLMNISLGFRVMVAF